MASQDLMQKLAVFSQQAHAYMTSFKWDEVPVNFSQIAWTAAPVATYLIVTLLIQTIVSKTGPVESRLLRFAEWLHNLCLSILSGLMLYGMASTGFAKILSTDEAPMDKFVNMICQGNYYDNAQASFWIWVFMVSKFIEFFDTWFFALRGKPLGFLHVWHHATVPIHMYFMYLTKWDPAFFGFCFNAFVHTIMYYYYSKVALGQRVWWKQLVTVIQIIQFVVCFGILGITLGKSECKKNIVGDSFYALVSTFTLYGSYLVLFIHFYLKTYKKNDKKKQA